MARVSSEQIKPLVALRTLVYNHAPYLHDYFRGILMQKTTFPFVAIVHDDASTDGSTDIIREYAEKIGWPRYHESKDVRAEDAISLGGWFIHTATMVYRNGLTADYPPACVRCYTGDHTLQMYAALKGKIRYIHEKTAAYRWSWPGSWTGRVSAGDFNPGIIEKWKGKMEMFESLDDYSDGRYRAVFRRPEANYAIQYLAQAKKMAPQALKALGCYLRSVSALPLFVATQPDTI